MGKEDNRASQLLKGLVMLNERSEDRSGKKRPKHEFGEFTFSRRKVKKSHNQALSVLKQKYKKDIDILSLGFEMGFCSFTDVLVGVRRCNVEFENSDRAQFHHCLLVLICRISNIYVLGEHLFFDKNAYTLPGISSVDNFQNKKVKELARVVASALENTECKRVFANELDSPIPDGIKVESNLVGEEPVVFDGYFWWED